MIGQDQAPTQTQTEAIQQILHKLNVKSIDQILLTDAINVDFISKTSANVHKEVVIKLLFDLQKLINQPEEIVKTNIYSLNLKDIISSWAGEGANLAPLEKIKHLEIGSSEITEIIGRSNGGKTYFCYEFVFYCLKKGLTAIFIDSNENEEGLRKYIRSKLGEQKSKQYKDMIKRLIVFKFRTLSQFSILIHSLGSSLIEQKKQKDSLIKKGVVTFIDCLSRIEMADPDTAQQNSTMDFDIIERVKRLLVTYSTRVSTIVYTNRIPTAYTLFNTIYKNEKHRPRCKNNNAKLWDSIAAKTILVQYSETMSNRAIKRIHLTKDLPNDLFTFQNSN